MNRKRPPSRVESWLFRAVLLSLVSLVPILIVTTLVARASGGHRSRGGDQYAGEPTPVLLARVRIMSIDPDREFIYVINNDAKEEDLTGWRLVSRGGKQRTYYFPVGYRLGPAAIVRIHTFGGMDSAGDLFWGLSPGDKVWEERGDTASLLDAHNHLVSSFSYARW